MADELESDLAGPEDLARRALRRFLRGGTWPALARELAWTAVHSAGANYATIEYRTSVVSQSDCEAQTWSTVQRWAGAQVVFPSVNARWIQVRVTLRSDGVAA